ncbi:8-oxoguanine DNA glycosylase [Luteimonas gilva]|uniref:8-oxoguanine DNA glycosylase n=1 Tax=Luteimonas gilva TaxID=2572684 RepID=A0A4U5JLA8_9GAMM|nr:8-oxoguanine DNA glycosylase [Luteimonas gilva]TKR30274.1 8-oxoguanine DNA glycosylase [Luteimonas gilva]
MMRKVALPLDSAYVERYLPAADEEVMPGVRWGEPWVVFTPAYWLTQAWMLHMDSTSSSDYRARQGVVEELVFCLLGGFGITAELNIAAFEACERSGLIANREQSVDAWAAELHLPLEINGRKIHYRYPNQKAKFLATAMQRISELRLEGKDARTIRDLLMQLPGVGFKTSSWVVRNVYDSDEVAILDIHLIRAGLLCGLFSTADRIERDYLSMESRFLQFSAALKLRPAALDCLIWDGMREAGELPIRLLAQQNESLAA